MQTPTATDLRRLDAALTALRRLWESPQVKRRFLAVLGRPVELSLVRTLRAIETAAADEPGVCHVADRLGVDASTASRFVDQATGGGWVTRTTSTRDRRRSVLGLTAEGDELLRASDDARTTVLSELVAGWDAPEVAQLGVLLQRLADSLPSPATTAGQR